MNASRKALPPAPGTDRPIQRRLVDSLRRLYDGIRAEPVPERFRHLLDRLERDDAADDDDQAAGTTREER